MRPFSLHLHRRIGEHGLLPIVACCALLLITPVSPAATKPNLMSLAHRGEQLTDDQAAKLESDLKDSPDDAGIRAQLLGYDFARKADTRASRLQNILWMIDHRTTDPLTGSNFCQIDATDDSAGYAKGKAAWDAQVTGHPNDGAIAANAAAFYATNDFDAADALMQQAITLQPKNAAWPERLAQIYDQRFKQHPDEAARLAPLALALRQNAYNLTSTPAVRFAILVRMPGDAIAATDLIAAKRYARQLLGTAPKFKNDPSYGDAIYWGNIGMGEVAFGAGRIDEAEDYLAAAVKSPGSDQLSTTGPDFDLARELLAKGERTPVHDYLVACQKLWPAGAQRLKSWIDTLDTGGTPDM